MWKSMLIGCAVFAATSTQAANIEVRNDSAWGQRIVIIGPIVLGDAEKFQAVATPLPDGTPVSLHSQGGLIFTAFNIGTTVQQRHFKTIVTGPSTCVSACSLIWLSG